MDTEQSIANRSPLDEYIASLPELPRFAVPFEPSPDFPIIQYSKDVNVVSGVRPVEYTGFHIAIEQSAELDNLFAGMGIPMVRVKHHNQTEDAYWQLDTIDCYLLCKSVPGRYGPDTWQTGVPYVWNNHKDKYTYGSQLQCLIFLRGLLELGYHQPLVLSLSRTVTEYFVQRVLRRQEAFLTAVKREFCKAGREFKPASYSYWMTVAKDEEKVYPKGGGSYYPPTMVISPPLTAGYLKEHQATPSHIEVIESFATSMLDTWAETAAIRLQEPPRDNKASQPTEPGEEAGQAQPPTSAKEAKQVQEEAEPISEQQLGSIRKLCGHLSKPEPEGLATLSFWDARKVIQQLTTEYKEKRQQPKPVSPLQALYDRAKDMGEFTHDPKAKATENVAAFLTWCGEVLGETIATQQEMTTVRIGYCVKYLDLIA